MTDGNSAADGRGRRIVVIGAGPGGISSAYYLREAGYTDVTVCERDGEVGGTWQRSRYPGLACDVMSHFYCFTWNLNPAWTRSYASQPEILEYMRRTVTDFDLWPFIRLNTGITGCRWDDDAAQWVVTTDGGEQLRADVVISAQGMFGELKWPGIEGQDSFAGVAVHTGAWPEDLDLTGTRVGVIGSAASAVQSIPVIAQVAGHLTVFQRSPNWVLPKEDYAHTEEQLEAFRTDRAALLEHYEGIRSTIAPSIPFSNPESIKMAEFVAACAIDVVEDPEVRAKLTPTTPWGCTRPLFSNDYYPTYNRDNVTLVTDGIERITPTGIVTADGVAHDLDVIVFATGYHVDKFASRIPITGRGGLPLEEAWSDGAQAYLGVTTRGFPNLFMLYGPNTNNGSILTMIEYQVEHVLGHVRRLRNEDLAWVDVRAEPMARYNAEVQEAIAGVPVWNAGCNGYYRSPSGRIVTQWPFSMTEFHDRTAAIDPADYEVARR